MPSRRFPARERYQDWARASEFHRRRFASPVGRIVNELERRALGRALAGVASGASVLDVACGSGRVVRWLAAWAYRPTGVDLSAAMLALARRDLPTVPLIRGEAEVLPFRRSAFDVVTCIRLMGHVPPETQAKILREMVRVSSGGAIVMMYVASVLPRLRRILRRGSETAPWYSLSRSALHEVLRVAHVQVAGEWRVAPLFSEAVVLRIVQDALPASSDDPTARDRSTPK